MLENNIASIENQLEKHEHEKVYIQPKEEPKPIEKIEVPAVKITTEPTVVKKEISIDHMAIEGLPEFLATISQEYTKRVLPDFLPEGTKVSSVFGLLVSGLVTLIQYIYMILIYQVYAF